MQIPAIDFSLWTHDEQVPAQLVRDLDAAFREVGFLTLRNAIPSARATDAISAAARRFFAGSPAAKAAVAYGSAEENFGYQAAGREALDPSAPADLKETFTMRNPLGASVSDSRWPSGEFRDAVLVFYREAMAVAQRLMRLLACALELPADFFVRCHGGENVTLRLLHYQAAGPVQPGQLGAGAHSDYGMLTLLCQDRVGGLEVRSAGGDWWPVPADPDAIVINAGDMLERWTNGRYRSTLHRVQPPARERYSIALFVDPDSATRIEPLPACVSAAQPARYPPTTAAEHLQERIMASHRAATS